AATPARRTQRLSSTTLFRSKLTYRYGVDPLTIIGSRMMLSLPFFALVGFYQARRARRGQIPKLSVRESLQLVFLGFIGYYLSSRSEEHTSELQSREKLVCCL